MTSRIFHQILFLLILIMFAFTGAYSSDNYLPDYGYDKIPGVSLADSSQYLNIIDSVLSANRSYTPDIIKSKLQRNDPVIEFVGSGMWGGILDTEVDGDLIYALNLHGLQIFDINDISAPIKNIPIENGAYSDLAFLENKILYLGRGDRVVIYDLSNDPLNPELLSTIYLPVGCMELIVQNDRLYLGRITTASSGISPEPSLFIYDVSDPAAPHLISSYSPPATNSWDLRRFVIIDDKIYAMNNQLGILDIISIADETDPVLLHRFALPAMAWDVGYLDPYLIALTNSGMAIYDLLDPINPNLVSIYPSTGNWVCEPIGDRL